MGAILNLCPRIQSVPMMGLCLPRTMQQFLDMKVSVSLVGMGGRSFSPVQSKFGDHVRFSVYEKQPNTLFVYAFFRVSGARELESRDRVVTSGIRQTFGSFYFEPRQATC